MAYCGTELVAALSQVTYTDLRFDDASTLDNYILGTLIPAAERLIDGYVGRRDGTLRHFNPHGSTSWLLDGSGKSTVWTPPKYSPTVYVGDVWIDGVSMGWSSPDDIKIHEQYLTVPGARFTKGDLNVKIYGTYGYVLVPADVAAICGQLAANVLLDAHRRGWASSGAASLGPMSVQVAASLFGDPDCFTDGMGRQLDTYRIKWVDVG